MANILISNKKYDLIDFESEEEFEKAVVANSKTLFGIDTVYIDSKKRIGESASYHKTIPDGYLFDFLLRMSFPRMPFIVISRSSY